MKMKLLSLLMIAVLALSLASCGFIGGTPGNTSDSEPQTSATDPVTSQTDPATSDTDPVSSSTSTSDTDPATPSTDPTIQTGGVTNIVPDGSYPLNTDGSEWVEPLKP